MDRIWGILWIVGAVIAGFILFIFVLRIYNGFRKGGGKGAGVTKWARGVRFSNGQLAAMRSLWQAYKHGRLPDEGILASLTAADLADLVKKSDIDFVPAALRGRDESSQRRRLVSELVNMGFDEIQAQIVTAMKFCKFGPASDS